MANVDMAEFQRIEQYLASLEQLFFSTFVGRRPDFDAVQDAFERLWYQVDQLYDLEVPVRTIHVHASPARCGSFMLSSNSKVGGGWMFRNRYLLGSLVVGIGIGCLVGYTRRSHRRGLHAAEQRMFRRHLSSALTRIDGNQVVVVLGSESNFGAHLVRELEDLGFIVIACDSHGGHVGPTLDQVGSRVYRCSLNPEDPASITSLISHLEEYGAQPRDSPLELHSVISLLGLTDPLNRSISLNSERSNEETNSSTDAVNHSSYLMRSLVVPTRAVQAILPFFDKWRRNKNEDPTQSKPGSIIFCVPKPSAKDAGLTPSLRAQAKAARQLSSLGIRSDIQSINNTLLYNGPSHGLKAFPVEIDPGLYFEPNGSDNRAVMKKTNELLYLILRGSSGHCSAFWPRIALRDTLSSASKRAALLAFTWKRKFTISAFQLGQTSYAYFSATLTWIRTTAWPKTLEVTKTILFALKHVNIQFQPIIIIPHPSPNATGVQRVARRPDGTLEIDGQLYILQRSDSSASHSSTTDARGSSRIPPESHSNLVISAGERTFIPEDGINVNVKVQSPLLASAASEAAILPESGPDPNPQRDDIFLQTSSVQRSDSDESSSVGPSEKGSQEKLPHSLTESDSHSQGSNDSREDWISLHET